MRCRGAAAAVGLLHMGFSLATGAALLCFYYSSSAATRCGAARKARFDGEAHKASRGARQVCAVAGPWAALLGLAAATAAAAGHRVGAFAALPLALPRALGRAGDSTSDGGGGGGGGDGDGADAADALVVIGALCALAAVCGDTWASELGSLSREPPVLAADVLTRCARPRTVPRGTNGGVSARGTLLSAAGGAAVGVAAAVALVAGQAAACALAADGRAGAGACAAARAALATWPAPRAHGLAELPPAWLPLLCAAAGFLGSAIDSLLGTFLQRSWVEVASGKVTAELPAGGVAVELTGDRDAALRALAYKAEDAQLHAAAEAESEPAAAAAGARKRRGGKAQAAAAHEYAVICGHDVLSNEDVNAATSLLTGAIGMYAAVAALGLAAP